MLGLLAGKTERIALGSGLFQIPARPPAATAMAAATLDVLSRRALPARPRRVGPAGLRGLVRRAVRAPPGRTREYVEIVRTALARETGRARGREYRVPLDGAKPLKLLAKPVQERIPIYLGAVGPKAVEQIGEIADGWLPFMLDPEHARRCSSRSTAASRGGPVARGHRRRGLPAWRSTTTSTRRATPCARGWPSTSGRWARGRRTSTSSSPSAPATATRRASARSAFLAGDRDGAAAALTRS